MITDKNKSFVIKYGPSSIHDDHIARKENIRESSGSLSLTAEQANRIFEMKDYEGLTDRTRRHGVLANHFDKLKPEHQEASIFGTDRSLAHVAQVRTKNHEFISRLLDKNDSDINSSLVQNRNLTDAHINRILDQMDNQKGEFVEEDHRDILRHLARREMSDLVFHKVIGKINKLPIEANYIRESVVHSNNSDDKIHKMIESVPNPYHKASLIRYTKMHRPNFDISRY